MDEGIPWQGCLLSVQPRIRLMRSFDERAHTYLGYVLRVDGRIGDRECEFAVAIGNSVQRKHQFQVGDRVSGTSRPVADPRTESSDFYKTSDLSVLDRVSSAASAAPPWHGVPPELSEYRERGHRRLDARTYGGKCISCIWGCRMPVEIIVDHWHPQDRQYRFETFCYGPKSCPLYRAGTARKVPGRRGMTWEEEDWVDEYATAHRAEDE